MSDIAVEVNHVWKKFHKGEFHDSLRDFVPALAKRIVGRGPKRTDLDEGDFWALKDVSFQVRQGEVLGIIGPNGAGKSTMLKVLSRILKPNRGRIQVNGRLRALIEIAAGFHPDLTGRENVYLNGTIMGMKKREIDKKFDEIVDFSGIEEFLDTPVKRYSSGMYARLGFAVAAHLDPEVLIVDEVLSVGDASFRKKCIGKMNDIASSGKTVLFVSHNMPAIESLCSRCMLLLSGECTLLGEPADVVSAFLGSYEAKQDGSVTLEDHPGRQASYTPVMRHVCLSSGENEAIAAMNMGGSLSIHVRYDLASETESPVLGIVIKTLRGMPVLGVNNRFIPGFEFDRRQSSGTISCHFESLPLMPGPYVVDLYFGNPYHDIDQVLDAISFEVLPRDAFGSGRLPPAAAGPVYWPATFSISSSD